MMQSDVFSISDYAIWEGLKRNAGKIVLIALALCCEIVLVSESGQFLNGLFPERGIIWGRAMATLLEATAVALIFYRVGKGAWAAWGVKTLVTTGIFAAVCGGSAMHAVNPIIESEGKISVVDAERIEILKGVATRANEQAGRFTEKNSINLGNATTKAQVADAAVSAAMTEASAAANSVAAKTVHGFKIALAVLFRMLLQAGGWLIWYWVSGMFQCPAARGQLLVREIPYQVFQENLKPVQENLENLQEVPSPLEISQKAQVLFEYLRSGGGVTRQKLLESRRFGNFKELDNLLDELAQANMIMSQNGQGKSNVIYREVANVQ